MGCRALKSAAEISRNMETEDTRNCLCQAKKEDIPLLALHHVRMFEEIRAIEGKTCDPDKMAQMELAYKAKLQAGLGTGALAAWVAKADGRVAASGAVSFISLVPVPEDPSDQVVFFHSLYTEKACRGQGLARQILETAIAHAREKGIRRFQLSASNAGRPLYKSLGFLPVHEGMRLWLD